MRPITPQVMQRQSIAVAHPERVDGSVAWERAEVRSEGRSEVRSVEGAQGSDLDDTWWNWRRWSRESPFLRSRAGPRHQLCLAWRVPPAVLEGHCLGVPNRRTQAARNARAAGHHCGSLSIDGARHLWATYLGRNQWMKAEMFPEAQRLHQAMEDGTARPRRPGIRRSTAETAHWIATCAVQFSTTAPAFREATNQGERTIASSQHNGGPGNVWMCFVVDPRPGCPFGSPGVLPQ